MFLSAASKAKSLFLQGHAHANMKSSGFDAATTENESQFSLFFYLHLFILSIHAGI
jgi:hypothetical protein